LNNTGNFSHLRVLQLLVGVRLEDVDKFPFSILRTAPFIEKLEIHVSSLLDYYLPTDIDILLTLGTTSYFLVAVVPRFSFRGRLGYTSYFRDEYRISMSQAIELVV
jgi:hypothetical protein